MVINEGSYNARVLVNLFNELGKEVKYNACRAFYHVFATALINFITLKHEC